MKKLLLTAFTAIALQISAQVTMNIPSLNLESYEFSNLYAGGELQGTLTSVGINATLTASDDGTYADDLAFYVTPTSSLVAGGPLQIGGYDDLTTTGERDYWSNGADDAPGTVVNDTYTLTTPLNFTTNPTYHVWLGNGYDSDSGLGTWSNITLTLAGVGEVLAVNDVVKAPVSISVYPNPATEYVIVKNTSSEKLKMVGVYDMSGKAVKTLLPVKTDGEMKINVTDLNSGAYLLLITTEKGKYTEKFIKK